MEMEYRYTKQQVARGARADAERNDAYFLFKNVTALRLTYQIRLLAFRARESRRKLIIRVPSSLLIFSSRPLFSSYSLGG